MEARLCLMMHYVLALVHHLSPRWELLVSSNYEYEASLPDALKLLSLKDRS